MNVFNQSIRGNLNLIFASYVSRLISSLNKEGFSIEKKEERSPDCIPVHIPIGKEDDFLKKLVRLVKKNSNAVTLEYLGVESFKETTVVDGEYFPSTYVYHLIGVKHTPIRVVEGYTYTGAVKIAGNIVTVHGVDPILNDMKSMVNACGMIPCHHCNVVNGRKIGHILRNESGDFVCIGSSCLADYIGEASAERISLQFDALDKASDYFSGIERTSYYELEYVLKAVFFWIDKNGYISKSKAEETGAEPTSSVFRNPKKMAEINANREAFMNDPSIHERYVAFINWIENLNPTTSFEVNLKEVASTPLVHSENLAILVGGIGFRSAAIKRELESKNKPEKKAPSGPIFGEDDKFAFGRKSKGRDTLPALDLTITGIYSSEGPFGWTTLVYCVDSEGRSFRFNSPSSRTFTVLVTLPKTGEQYLDDRKSFYLQDKHVGMTFKVTGLSNGVYQGKSGTVHKLSHVTIDPTPEQLGLDATYNETFIKWGTT